MRTARGEVDHDVYEEGRDTGPGMRVSALDGAALPGRRRPDGDVVVIAIPGVGTITNQVQGSQPPVRTTRKVTP